MRKNPADDSRHEPDALRKASIPLLWGEFIQSMLLWMPSLALSVWASATDVAVFQAASRTAILISFIIMAVRNVVTPKIAQMHSRGETADLQRLIRHADNLATLAALPLWLGLMLFPAVIMGFFGAAYVPYASVLSIVCAGQVVCVMTGCAHPLLQMTGHERVLRELLVYTFFFSVLVNIILVRLYGVYGGATAMALTWALTHAVCTVLVYRRLGIVCCALVPLRHLPPSST
jgi:O-antigen/teichoic acid export membrane protein